MQVNPRSNSAPARSCAERRSAFSAVAGALTLFGVAALAARPAAAGPSEAKARALLDNLSKQVGGMDDLHRLKDVEYTYIYRTPDGKMDLSVERYIFDGEHSCARYIVHEVFVSPGVEGDVVQCHVGGETEVSIGGVVSGDEKVIGLAKFLRPTNYYWFAMMMKLKDPGVQARYTGRRTVEGTDYAMVDVGFGDETSDRYLLYIHPQTGLVDRFLFTVKALGVTEPFLMEVAYESVDGVRLPTRRRYTPATWEGASKGQPWTAEIMTSIHFNNGFSPSSLKADLAR